MQREDDIMKQKSSKFKSGIAMIMAIAVIVVIATIMALSIALSSQTNKRTTDVYVYEQAVLLAKSAAEYTLLRISEDNNSTDPCHVNALNFSQDYYDINVSVKYSYTNYPTDTTKCPTSVRFAPVTTDEQNGSVLMDISVSVNNNTITSEPIRYFRRTIQKL